MKALSIRQPWAELILRGRKTIELRTWKTHYRGRIAVHAGKRVNEAACVTYGLDPATVVRGALVGTVEVVEVVALDDDRWEALRDHHLALGAFPGDLVGWRLASPQRLPKPIPMRGRMGLFNVPDELLPGPGHTATSVVQEQIETGGQGEVETGSKGQIWKSDPQDGSVEEGPTLASPLPLTSPCIYRVGAEAGYDPEKPFELRVVPRDGGDYGLALYQWPVAANVGRESNALKGTGARPTKPQLLVSLAGDSLRAVADHVLEALRKASYKVTDLSWERRKPFQLDEETGLRLGLLFLSIKPLSRMDRVEAISSGLRMMSSEEAYYWFSKCAAEANAANARRALRILLAGE